MYYFKLASSIYHGSEINGKCYVVVDTHLIMCVIMHNGHLILRLHQTIAMRLGQLLHPIGTDQLANLFHSIITVTFHKHIPSTALLATHQQFFSSKVAHQFAIEKQPRYVPSHPFRQGRHRIDQQTRPLNQQQVAFVHVGLDQLLESTGQLFAEEDNVRLGQTAAVRTPVRNAREVGLATVGDIIGGETTRRRRTRTGSKVAVTFHQLLVGYSRQTFQAVDVCTCIDMH
jgi:hypothetical protein